MSYDGMVKRFMGMTKAEMLAKVKSKNCWPMWDKTEREDALLAIKNILSGKIENVRIVDTLDEIKKLPDNLILRKRVKTDEEKLLEEIENSPLGETVEEEKIADDNETADEESPATIESPMDKEEKKPVPPKVRKPVRRK